MENLMDFLKLIYQMRFQIKNLMEKPLDWVKPYCQNNKSSKTSIQNRWILHSLNF